VDANQSWKDIDAAIKKSRIMADLGVELIEQPFPKGALGQTRKLKNESPIPMIADEDVQRLEDVDQLAPYYNGINIKLMKCTGIYEAFKMIQKAKECDLQIFLGCMTESSIGISAGAQLAGLVDWCDLDGNLLITNDPCNGIDCHKGELIPNSLSGIGIVSDTELKSILNLTTD